MLVVTAAGSEPDWVGGQGSVYLAFSARAEDGRAIYVGFSNAGGVESATIAAPPPGTAWHRVVDTGDLSYQPGMHFLYALSAKPLQRSSHRCVHTVKSHREPTSPLGPACEPCAYRSLMLHWPQGNWKPHVVCILSHETASELKMKLRCRVGVARGCNPGHW